MGVAGTWQAVAHLGFTCHKTDQRLFSRPGLCNAMCVYAKQAHATLRPEIASDAGLDSGLEQIELRGDGPTVFRVPCLVCLCRAPLLQSGDCILLD